MKASAFLLNFSFAHRSKPWLDAALHQQNLHAIEAYSGQSGSLRKRSIFGLVVTDCQFERSVWLFLQQWAQRIFDDSILVGVQPRATTRV